MSNCLFYAFNRWRKEGGFVVVRKSHHGWWPHFLWTGDHVTFWEFSPMSHCRPIIPPLLFRGYIRSRTKENA